MSGSSMPYQNYLIINILNSKRQSEACRILRVLYQRQMQNLIK